jgi:hypothetical protein
METDWEEKLDWEEHKSGSLVQHMIAGSAAGVAGARQHTRVYTRVIAPFFLAEHESKSARSVLPCRTRCDVSC